MAEISTESVKKNSLKIHIMPDDVHNEYVSNDMIVENELYLVEDELPALPLNQGGTGVVASSIEGLRTALGLAQTNHSSTDVTYGTSTATKYGHVKLSDSIDLISSENSGVAATPTAIRSLHTMINGKADINNDTVISQGADFAEVGEWSDGNKKNSNRIGFFVSVDKSTAGITMRKATSTSDIRGVTIKKPAFAANATADKFDVNGDLKQQYDYVAFAGFARVYQDGTCELNGRCVSDDRGMATKSPNSMGYQVIEIGEDGTENQNTVLILVEPQGDTLVRVKTDVVNLNNTKQNKIAWLTKTDIDKMLEGTYESDNSDAVVDDIVDSDTMSLFAVQNEEE